MSPEYTFQQDAISFHKEKLNANEIDSQEELLSSRNALHNACEERSSPVVVADLIELLPLAATSQDHRGQLPLHVACEKQCSYAVLTLLLKAAPESSQQIDERGHTPLHCACQCRDPSLQTVQMLTEEYPQAVLQPSNDGFTPRMLASQFAHHSPVIEYLEHIESTLLSEPTERQGIHKAHDSISTSGTLFSDGELDATSTAASSYEDWRDSEVQVTLPKLDSSVGVSTVTADPIPFMPVRMMQCCRGNVFCYSGDGSKASRKVLANVLHVDGAECPRSYVSEAYWPHPGKARVQHKYGYDEVCLTLKRSPLDQENEGSDDDQVRDLLFQITNLYSSVRVYEMDQISDPVESDLALSEVAALQHLGTHHPNVRGCKEVLHDGRKIYVIMDFAGSNDIFDAAHNAAEGEVAAVIHEQRVCHLFRQLISGLQYIHSSGVSLHEFSPANIAVDNAANLCIKPGRCLRIPYLDPNMPATIVDASGGYLACRITPQIPCGPLSFMPPEVYRQTDGFVAEAANVWTAGVLLFSLLTGIDPYELPLATDFRYYSMTRGLERMLFCRQVDVSTDCLDLLKGMLSEDPELRPSIEAITVHPWLQRVWTFAEI